MVHAVRTACIMLTKVNNNQQQLMYIIFHHRAMVAWTLFDIYQSLVGHLISNVEDKIDSTELRTIRGVLKQIKADYQAVCDKQNNHLHATWFVGWGNDTTTDFSEIGFIRGKSTRDGLKFMAGPKQANDVIALAKECEDLADFFYRFHAALTWHTGSIVSNNFVKEGKRWKSARRNA